MSVPYVAPLTVQVARGEDKTFNWTHQTSATDTTAINITGWTITVVIKPTQAATAILTKTASITVGASGTYSWSVTHADTLLPAQTWPLNVWRVDSGSATLMGSGTFQIVPEVLY